MVRSAHHTLDEQLVFRMKNKHLPILLIGTLFLSLVFMFPYLSNDLSLEHDTLFHLSRIEGLAQSFKNGKLFPDIYPLKNDGFGYGSALFYCTICIFKII